MSTEQNSSNSNSPLEREIRQLGENIATLLRTMWDCEERKSLERELVSVLENVNRTITQATEQLQARRDRVVNTINEVWRTAHGPQIVREIELGLADTLHKLNEALRARAQNPPAQETSPHPADEPPTKPE